MFFLAQVIWIMNISEIEVFFSLSKWCVEDSDFNHHLKLLNTSKLNVLVVKCLLVELLWLYIEVYSASSLSCNIV